ncbi:MAG: PD40 domain-containing protein [Devosia nanyangense]|uniref:PD40 domain-containing protein n=1 Tax=Devosia nanyangense TaxID=1228055 RepID=A0A933L5F5_9HYPH|nr:PD40 domain-containing protein [Devosia nanyangense]
MIGTITAAESVTEIDLVTGRKVTRLTDGRSNCYALYYFTTSITPDGRYLVFHSERSGSVQLYRLDLQTGAIGQLTDGHTADAGWAVWCEWHLGGIYNHLSAIHPQTGEVTYFEDGEIRGTDVASFANRRVAMLPAGRMPIGQAAFSPDGRWFGYIHADEAAFRALLSKREADTRAGTFSWNRDHHHVFRNAIGATLAVVDTATGEQRTVIATDYHFHHVLFVDNETILLNHPKGCAGMWVVKLDGSGVEHLRPATAPGAHGAAVNHQVVTARGIAYEATVDTARGERQTWFGIFDPESGEFSEKLLPVDGYVHTGFDPAGRFAFIENAGARHELLTVHRARAPGGPLETRLLRTLMSPAHDDQRHHAHPFLAPDRRRLYFTDWSAEGFAQVCAMDVADLVAVADAG